MRRPPIILLFVLLTFKFVTNESFNGDKDDRGDLSSICCLCSV